jgi:hypothetical protein
MPTDEPTFSATDVTRAARALGGGANRAPAAILTALVGLAILPRMRSERRMMPRELSS